MSMVRDFVREAGGFVTLASESGRGTTIALYLPAAPVAVVAKDAATMPVAGATLTPSLRSS
jgi:hypothetical protein